MIVFTLEIGKLKLSLYIKKFIKPKILFVYIKGFTKNKWVTLRMHKNDTSIKSKNGTYSWSINTNYFVSKIKITGTGKNSVKLCIFLKNKIYIYFFNFKKIF